MPIVKHEAAEITLKYAVILPALNGMRTIKVALDSIVSQSLHPTKICVVDGGSSDSTLQFLKTYAKTEMGRKAALMRLKLQLFEYERDTRTLRPLGVGVRQ